CVECGRAMNAGGLRHAQRLNERRSASGHRCGAGIPAVETLYDAANYRLFAGGGVTMFMLSAPLRRDKERGDSRCNNMRDHPGENGVTNASPFSAFFCR